MDSGFWKVCEAASTCLVFLSLPYFFVLLVCNISMHMHDDLNVVCTIIILLYFAQASSSC